MLALILNVKKELSIIETRTSKDEIIQNLAKLTANRGSIWNLLIARRPFIGQVLTDNIQLKTYDSPPIELKIEIEETEEINKIRISSSLDDSLSKSLKLLVYALGFPISGAFILWKIIEHPTSVSVYIWSTMSIFAIIAIGKFQEFLTPKPSLSNVLKSIRKHVAKD